MAPCPHAVPIRYPAFRQHARATTMTAEARESRQPWLLLAPSLTAVTLLLFVPLLFIVVYSFWLRTATGADVAGFHLDNWQEALSDAFYRDILLHTLKIAAISQPSCAHWPATRRHTSSHALTATRY